MPNPIQAAWSYLRGTDLVTPSLSLPGEQKFAPIDATVPWEQVQSLVYTLSREQTEDKRGDGNSAVFACLMAMALGSIEPPLSVYTVDSKGKRNPKLTDPLQDFLDNMNPSLDTLELRFWLAWAKHIDGNAYLLKVRGGRGGPPMELWPVSPTVMIPWTERGSPNFIDWYRWEREPGKFERVPVEDVVHFRLGIDDRDPRKGMSNLKRLLREVASDAEATRFSQQLLQNFGIPGLVVELPVDSEVTRDDRLQMKQDISNAFGGANRGNVGVLSDGATMKQFGFNPRELDLTALHNIPESRICAVLGVPPAVAGLNIGLEQTSNYASLRVVFESFTERRLIPLWRMDEDKWNRQLKPDFTTDRKLIIAHDLNEVRALQEDQDALFARLDLAVQHKWVFPDEAREQVGLPPMPDGKGMEFEKPPAPAPRPGQPGQPGPNDQTTNPPADQAGKDLTELLLKAPIDEWPQFIQGLIDLAEPGFEADLKRFQAEQMRRVQRAIVSNG
jgi:HK97 family phage portal protein